MPGLGQDGRGEWVVGEGELREGRGQHRGREAMTEQVGELGPGRRLGQGAVGVEQVSRPDVSFEQSVEHRGVGRQESRGDR